MKHDFDALIVGGGPAGATAAILLARAGWSVALLEQQTFPRRKVCGECITAGSLAVLDFLGIGEAFARLAGPALRQVALYAGNRCIVAALPPLATGGHAWGRALGRDHLDSLLMAQARCAGATIFQPLRARKLEQWERGYRCVAGNRVDTTPITITASNIILADGSWTPQRALLEPVRVPPRNADLLAFKANFLDGALDPSTLPVLLFPGGYGGMVMADHGIVTLACCIRRDVLAAVRARCPNAPAAEAVYTYLIAQCEGVETALRGARREGVWLSVGPIRPGVRPAHPRPGVFAIGNAAGEAHPIVGEGISMALQSAVLLCEQLTAPGATAGTACKSATGRAYAAQWHRHFAQRIRMAAIFAHIAMRPVVAPALLPVLQRWPALLTLSARLAGKARPAQLSAGSSMAARVRAQLPDTSQRDMHEHV